MDVLLSWLYCILVVEFQHIKAPKAVPLHHCDLASREKLLQDRKEECAGHRKILQTVQERKLYTAITPGSLSLFIYSHLFYDTVLKLWAASNQNAEIYLPAYKTIWRSSFKIEISSFLQHPTLE